MSSSFCPWLQTRWFQHSQTNVFRFLTKRAANERCRAHRHVGTPEGIRSKSFATNADLISTKEQKYPVFESFRALFEPFSSRFGAVLEPFWSLFTGSQAPQVSGSSPSLDCQNCHRQTRTDRSARRRNRIQYLSHKPVAHRAAQQRQRATDTDGSRKGAGSLACRLTAL